MNELNTITGWGIKAEDGSEIWDAPPVFTQKPVTFFEKTKLFFYPKKWFTYRYIAKAVRKHTGDAPFRILDVGCGTGSSIIDFKRLFGNKVEVVGLDVVTLQIDLAHKRMLSLKIDAQIEWYDGDVFPFKDVSFDAVYTSDVLGHVPDAASWLREIGRVLRLGGVFAMFSESALGKHAFIRNYLYKHGLNIDPHAEFHISLHSKKEIKQKVKAAGIKIKVMKSAFWFGFFVHPDEYKPVLQSQSKFPILKLINKVLFKLKQVTHPISMAAAEFYGTLEMYLVGSFVESQGYIVLGKKKDS